MGKRGALSCFMLGVGREAAAVLLGLLASKSASQKCDWMNAKNDLGSRAHVKCWKFDVAHRCTHFGELAVRIMV